MLLVPFSCGEAMIRCLSAIPYNFWAPFFFVSCVLGFLAVFSLNIESAHSLLVIRAPRYKVLSIFQIIGQSQDQLRVKLANTRLKNLLVVTPSQRPHSPLLQRIISIAMLVRDFHEGKKLTKVVVIVL